jgi:hypothetical protein
MAAVTKWYGKALIQVLNKEVDWNTDSIKVALCTSTYTPDQDAHDYFDDVTNEVEGEGYTAGGKALTNCTVAYDAPSKAVQLKADNLTWDPVTLTARYAVIYDATPATAATRPLVAYVDFGEDKSPSGGALTIAWADGVVLKGTVS